MNNHGQKYNFDTNLFYNYNSNYKIKENKSKNLMQFNNFNNKIINNNKYFTKSKKPFIQNEIL